MELRNQNRYQCVIANPDDRLLSEAKRLHATVYLRRGFVETQDIAPEGHLSPDADPYQAHATYFVVVRKDDPNIPPLALARQINALPSLGLSSFPVLSQARIRREACTLLQSCNPAEIVEISALAKRHRVGPFASLLLYRAMLYHSMHGRRHRYWIMALDVDVFRSLRYSFGDALRVIGEVTAYPGGDVVPLLLDVARAFSSLAEEIRNSTYLQKYYRHQLLQFFAATPTAWHSGDPSEWGRPAQAH